MTIEHQFERGRVIKISLDGIVAESRIGSHTVAFSRLGQHTREIHIGEEATDLAAYRDDSRIIVVVLSVGETGSVSHFYDDAGNPAKYHGRFSEHHIHQ